MIPITATATPDQQPMQDAVHRYLSTLIDQRTSQHRDLRDRSAKGQRAEAEELEEQRRQADPGRAVWSYSRSLRR